MSYDVSLAGMTVMLAGRAYQAALMHHSKAYQYKSSPRKASKLAGNISKNLIVHIR